MLRRRRWVVAAIFDSDILIAGGEHGLTGGLTGERDHFLRPARQTSADVREHLNFSAVQYR